MMCRRRLFFITIVCLYLTTASAIQCYLGVEGQCISGPDMTDCGSGETCQCVKYRFKCEENMPGCTAEDRENQVKKWVYTVISAKTCTLMESLPSYFDGVSCCSTNKCNTPDNDTCSTFLSRRRSLRKLTNLFHFKL